MYVHSNTLPHGTNKFTRIIYMHPWQIPCLVKSSIPNFGKNKRNTFFFIFFYSAFFWFLGDVKVIFLEFLQFFSTFSTLSKFVGFHMFFFLSFFLNLLWFLRFFGFLDTRISGLLQTSDFFVTLRGPPLGFWNGLDWRALVED